MGKKKNKGVALIAVIVMIVLLSSIIIAVVLTATISIKRANYYNDKLTAYEIAENGIQEILYRLNYYGYREYNGNPDYTRISWIGSNLIYSTVTIPKWYETEILSKGFSLSNLSKYETEISYPELGRNANCTLYFIDINSPTLPETDLDLIISKGNYNGRTTTISFLLRGAGEIEQFTPHFWYGDFAHKNTNRAKGICGITEAFNKHVIYANQVSGSGTTVKGNITTTSQKPYPYPSTLKDATWTETTNVNLPDLESIPSIPLPTRPATFTENYDNAGNCNGNPVLPTGVSFTPPSGPYTFGTGYTQSGPVKIEGANATLTGNCEINNYFYITGGNLTITSTVKFQNDACLEIETGTLTISANSTIDGDLKIKTSNNNTISNSNITINGSLIWEGSQLTISGTSIRIYGHLIVKGNNLIISNTATNFQINASSSNREAGIIVNNGDLTISAPISITIGNNQITGILVYADTGNRTVNINASPYFTFPSGITNQLPIIGYNTGGGINITISGNIPRGIFAKGNSDNGNITINSGTINGCLIANGTVNLNGGTLTYNSDPFKNNSEVYKGFVGGRRRYIPVPGSWRIEW